MLEAILSFGDWDLKTRSSNQFQNSVVSSFFKHLPPGKDWGNPRFPAEGLSCLHFHTFFGGNLA